MAMAKLSVASKVGLFVCAAFFAVNLLFVTYAISAEAVVIPDIAEFQRTRQYPIWPPRPLIDALHTTWAKFDRLIMARPVFYKTFMWWELLFFGPYYAMALYAFWNHRNWIRIPSIVFSSVMLTKMSCLITEGTMGLYASPVPAMYVAAHTPHVLIPLWLLLFMWTHPHPFGVTEKAKSS